MKYFIYTDGSSRGNPGAAGWAAVIMDEINVREYNGRFENATNNQMEIYAVLFSLTFILANLNENDSVEIWSDSEYTVKGCNDWVFNWSKNNWKNSQKKEVLNKDLWQTILKTISDLKYKNINFSIKHLRGHQGHIYNERADVLCVAAALEQDIELYKGNMTDYKDLLHKS